MGDLREAIGAVVFLVGALILLMMVEAIEVTVAGYVFLDLPFWNGWHAAWDRPLLLALFAAVSGVVSVYTRRRR